MQNKRGQLTIFVIIAVVMVIGVILYFYFGGNIGEQRYDPEIIILRDNLLDCLKSLSSESIDSLGIQGGYLEVPEPKETTVPISTLGFLGLLLTYETPYYYYEGKVYTPSEKQISTEIEKTVKFSSQVCLENLKENPSFQNIDYTDVSVNAQIKDDEIEIVYQTILTITLSNKSVNIDLSKTPVRIPSNIRSMSKISTFIATTLKENNEWMSYTDISILARENNLYIGVTDSEDGYQNTVEITSLNEGFYPKRYIFKNKFSHEDLSDIEPLI